MGYDETLFTVLRSGNEIDLRDPDPAAVTFDDLINNLVSITRYVGSEQNVAQHCLYVAEHLQEQGYEQEIQLHGLLHDIQEAYLGDVPRPTKNLDPSFEQTLHEYEDKVLTAIYEALGLDLPDEETEQSIKQADTEVALIELEVLGTEGVLAQTVDRFPDWDMAEAQQLFEETTWWKSRNWKEDSEETEQLFRTRYERLR